MGDDRFAIRGTVPESTYQHMWVCKGRTVVYVSVETKKTTSMKQLNKLALKREL